MALIDSGDRVQTLTGTNARAQDGSGGSVIVSASHEAIQDYGWQAIFDVASKKHATGQIEPGSNPPLVSVKTGDF
jgi:hypothetical protein